MDLYFKKRGFIVFQQEDQDIGRVGPSEEKTDVGLILKNHIEKLRKSD
jgi:hypothetical protein